MPSPRLPVELDNYLAEYAALQAEGGADPPLLSLAQTRELAHRYACTVQQVEVAALARHILPERYQRNLGTLGWEGQARLLQSCVAVVGAGGLGGWIIEGLARMGVGHIIIIDGDSFQDNNLNRQLGCTESTLGCPKAGCLARRVGEVNGAVRVTARVAWLTEENGSALVAGASVLVDALDSLPARFLLERIAAQMQVPMVHGAIGGYMGQVMTIFPGDPGLGAFYGAPTFERGMEIQLGNPAATPMMIAAWQIQEVVKILVGQGNLVRHRVLIMDAEHGDVAEIHLS
jgi:molybdopterin/thiamine biosynthesis adenylyltransferase